MNEMTNIIGMRTPIEIALDIDSEGMTTARKLYEFLQLAQGQFSRWAKKNIEENEFFEENVDWWGFDIVSNGNNCKDYRLSTEFAKHLSMESHSARGKEARQYFVAIEDKVKQKAIDRTQLSPQMQMFYAIADGQAKMELEQKRQAEQISKVETTVNNMKEIFTQPIGDWKAEINERVREISIKSGIDFQTIYNQMYGELETTAHCSLKRLQENKQKRMEKAGNTKSAIKSETTKIAVVFEKPQLRAIFEGIVKKYAMRYLLIELKTNPPVNNRLVGFALKGGHYVRSKWSNMENSTRIIWKRLFEAFRRLRNGRSNRRQYIYLSLIHI